MKWIFLIVSMLFFTSQLFAQEKVVYPDLLVFTSPRRCLPCARLEPVLKTLESTFNIVKVNPDVERQISNDYQINSIPTIIILKDGVELRRFVGFQSIDTLRLNLKNR